MERRILVVVTRWGVVVDGLSDWVGERWSVRAAADTRDLHSDCGEVDTRALVVVGPDINPASVLCGLWRSRVTDDPVIVLTGSWDANLEAMLVRCGAAAVVALDGLDPGLFRHLLSQVLHGRRVVSDEAMAHLLNDGDGLILMLPERQQQVALLIRHGASIREIADELMVSESTVKTQLARLSRRLGVLGRDALVSELAVLIPQMTGPMSLAAEPQAIAEVEA